VTTPTEQAPDALAMGPEVFADLCIAGNDWSSDLERCGILFGIIDGTTAYVAGCAELQNVSSDPAHSYEFDAHVQAKSWSRVENWGYDVLAVWHTHPEGPAGPSGTDIAFAMPWLLYPVLSPGGDGAQPEVHVFRLTDTEGGYEEVPLEVQQSAPMRAEAVKAARTNAS
jgi:proteasome lid subunit RPN8/RPN11